MLRYSQVFEKVQWVKMRKTRLTHTKTHIWSKLQEEHKINNLKKKTSGLCKWAYFPILCLTVCKGQLKTRLTFLVIHEEVCWMITQKEGKKESVSSNEYGWGKKEQKDDNVGRDRKEEQNKKQKTKRNDVKRNRALLKSLHLSKNMRIKTCHNSFSFPVMSSDTTKEAEK